MTMRVMLSAAWSHVQKELPIKRRTESDLFQETNVLKTVKM